MKGIFLLTLLICLFLSSCSAEELFSEVMLDIRIGENCIGTLSDGSFILIGNNGLLADDARAKALSIHPSGTINWEISGVVDGKTSDSFGRIIIGENDEIFANAYINDKSTFHLVEISNGIASSLQGFQVPTGYSGYTVSEGYIIRTRYKEEWFSGEKYNYPKLTFYNQQWQKIWEQNYETSFSVKKIISLSNGYVFIGYIFFANDPIAKAYVAKLDMIGNIEWDIIFAEDKMCAVEDIIALDDHQMMIVGGRMIQGEEEAATMTLDLTGQVTDYRVYSELGTFFDSITETEQGMLLTSLFHQPNGDNQVILTTLHEATVAHQTFDLYPMYRPFVTDVLQTPRGIYLVASGLTKQETGKDICKTLLKKIY